MVLDSSKVSGFVLVLMVRFDSAECHARLRKIPAFLVRQHAVLCFSTLLYILGDMNHREILCENSCLESGRCYIATFFQRCFRFKNV